LGGCLARVARNPVLVPGLHTNRGAKRAREARERLGLDPAAPLQCVLTVVEEDAKVPVVVGSLPEDVAGAVYRHCDQTLVWVNGAHAVVRQRFTVAHEYGHVCCGHGSTAIDTPAMLTGETHDPVEVQANAFAAEFLAPRAGMQVAFGREPTLEDLVRVAARYGISRIATLYRCRTLGLVGQKRAERLREEIDAGMAEYIDVEPLDDALSRIVDLPRLPPALAASALAGVLSGEVSVGAAADAAGCDSSTLADAAAALAR
jgi:Zn-dependent peptidase ImmA (M78 family)